MPFKRIYRKKRLPIRRRLNRKRIIRKRPIARIPKQLGPSLPEHLTTKITLATGQIGTSTTTTMATKTYNFTNLYDLLNDSTYLQPRYFDQLSLIYNRYRVNAVRWEFELSALTGSSYFAIGCFPHDYTPAASNFKALQEDNRWKIYTTSLNKGPLHIKGFKTTAATEDVPKRVIHDDDSYSAEVNSSVVYKPFIRLAWQALDETASYGHWIQGRLTFYTTFYQLKLPSAS